MEGLPELYLSNIMRPNRAAGGLRRPPVAGVRTVTEQREGMPPPRLASPLVVRVGEGAAVIRSPAMNERQRSHINYFLERVEHWRRLKPHVTVARTLAARDA